MRIGIVCSAIVVACALVSVAGAARITLTAGPTIPDCAGQAVAPTSMTLTCADANYGLAGMTWQRWGAATATGSGSARANDCTPYCAAGTFHAYPVTATVSRIATCRSRRKQYTRLVLAYPGPRPKGIGATDTWMFPCDPTGPRRGSITVAATKTKGELLLTGDGWQQGGGCTPAVAIGFADKARPFASPKVGSSGGFRLNLVDVRSGTAIVARQQCETTAGSRLYESTVTVT